MIIFPAIDIMGGKVVRLKNGDYDTAKYYECSVERAAQSFVSAGATHIHAVDLDGAKRGEAVNAQAVKRIINSCGAFVEIGGGIRTEAQIEEYLAAGAKRVVLGTVAVKDPDFTRNMIAKYGKSIAIGVDAHGGKVAVSGWRDVTDVESVEFCKTLACWGADTVIYTDIACDGMLSGTNLSVYRELVKIPGLKVTASGGISTLSELSELKAMGVHAAVLGKALYENKLDLAQAVKISEG